MDMNCMINKELKVRLLTGSVMFLAALLGILWSEILFVVMIFAIALLVLSEWYDIAHRHGKVLHGYLLFLPALMSSLFLRMAENGEYLLLLAMILIVAVDSCAYFGGKFFGGKKLLPQISPNKTVSGLVTGVFGAVLTVHIVAAMLTNNTSLELPGFWLMTLFIIVLALLEQAGDFMESYFKRKFKVKDSGQLIPGHGGILDRLDGIIFVLPALWIIVLICY